MPAASTASILPVTRDVHILKQRPIPSCSYTQIRLNHSERSLSTEDRIRQQLQDCNHTQWGLPVYRCDYIDSEAFYRLITYLYAQTHFCLTERYEDVNDEPNDILEKLDWPIFDHLRGNFEGASKRNVRDHFESWATDPAMQRADQGEAAMIGCTLNPKGFALGLRHEFCLYIDTGALRNIVSRQSSSPDVTLMLAEGLSDEAYVTLIQRRERTPEDKELEPTDEEVYEGEGCEDDNDVGCEDDNDVGCTRISPESIAEAVYSALEPSRMDKINKQYQHPPQRYQG